MLRRVRSALAVLAALGVPVLVLAGTGSGTNYTVTPWMQLTPPTVGVCGALGIEPPGRSWLELINSSLYTLDGHNHAPGSGLPVPSSGLNINGDVPWNSNNVTQLRSARFTPLMLGSLTASDVGALIVSGSDLYYVDTAANQVRLTASGALAGTPGSISGLVSPAAATYTPASKLFTWTSSSGFAANMSQGPTSVCDATISGGKCGTLQAPAGLASNYTLTLPTALPAAAKPLTISSAGALAPADTFTVTGAIAAGSLSSSGTTSTATLAATGNATVGGTLGVTGAVTLTGKATSAATASGDGSTTLTTKGYVEGGAGLHLVQNGTGIGQSAGNQVMIGWDGSASLKATVDATDLGAFAMRPYVDGSSAAVTGRHASLPSGPTVFSKLGRAYFGYGDGITATGGIADAGDNMLYFTGNILFSIPAGYRPSADVLAPISVFKASAGGTDRLQTGYVRINADGAVRFHLRGGTAGSSSGGTSGIAATDILYFSTVPSWDAYQ